MLSILFSLIHFYFEVTKNFRNFQKKMKRLFLRGSSSQGSKDKQIKEKEKAKYNLPRVAEVWPCEWPCDNLLRAAGIYEDFYSLAKMRASLTSSTTGSNSISYLPILSCKTFTIILRIHHLQ